MGQKSEIIFLFFIDKNLNLVFLITQNTSYDLQQKDTHAVQETLYQRKI
jgi:hypothetical protein